MTFDWEGWNVASAWAATGILRGDIQSNLYMLGSDFEGAVYVLMR